MHVRHVSPFDAAVAVATMLALAGCVSSPAPVPSAPDRSSTTPPAAGTASRTPPASDAGASLPGSLADSLPAGSPSSRGSSQSGGAGPTRPTVVAQTSEERRVAIDRKLDDSLGTFDAQLREEQERVAKERDAPQAGADVSTTGDGSATTDAQSSTEPSDRSGTPTAEGPDQDARGNARGRRGNSDRTSPHAGDLKSEKSASAGATHDNSGNGATARNIPDGSDDDVVARRLRKAAEQETDPELKDKLWKEYSDYKNNAGK